MTVKECRDLNSKPSPPPPPPPTKMLGITILFIEGYDTTLMKDQMRHVKDAIELIRPTNYKDYARFYMWYYRWCDYDEIKNAILRFSRHSSPNNYLLVMGYSYGADTAFSIAWNEIAPGQSWYAPLMDDLWLLDPVGRDTSSRKLKGVFPHIVNDLIGGYEFKGDRRERLRIKMVRRYDRAILGGIKGWNCSDGIAYAGGWWSYHNPHARIILDNGYHTNGAVSKNYNYRDAITKKPATKREEEGYHHDDLYKIMNDYGFFELAAKKCLDFYYANKRE